MFVWCERVGVEIFIFLNIDNTEYMEIFSNEEK